MKKIRSSKELRESMENLERVVNFEGDNVDLHAQIDVVMADAYDEDLAAKEHVAEVMDNLTKDADSIVPNMPEAKLPTENKYTTQLKLDENLIDFKLTEARPRTAARDENDSDKYLDYDMLEFVTELLSSGSKGITNIAPIRPQVMRPNRHGVMEMQPIPTFSPYGVEIIDKHAVAELGLSLFTSDISEMLKILPKNIKDDIQSRAYTVKGFDTSMHTVFDEICDLYADQVKRLVDKYNTKMLQEDPDYQPITAYDVLGYALLNNLKTTGTPQISQLGNKVVIYAQDLKTFDYVKEGLKHYFITTEEPRKKRNILSHWNYSMVIDVPCDANGEPMLLVDYLDEHGWTFEDVFVPSIAKSFENAYKRMDLEKKDMLKKKIFDKYVAKAFRDGTLDLEDVYADMCDELKENDIECDRKLYKSFMSNFEDDEYADEDDDI